MLAGCHFQLTLELSHAIWQIICQELACFVVSMSQDAEQQMQGRDAAAMQAACLFLAEVQYVERIG